MNPLAELVRLEIEHERATLFDSYENLLTSAEGFGLTSASDGQRAIARAYEGRDIGDELWAKPEIQKIFHFRPKHGLMPAEFLFLAGIRVGKTLFAATAAVYQSHLCSLEYAPGFFLKDGEMPRFSIVSLSKDNARECYSKILGTMQARPALRKLLVDYDAETIVVKHVSGKSVEIKVVAGARTGGTLISRWSAGAVFDEAPRMLGQDEAIVNLTEQRNAMSGRMLPRTVLWYIGSPSQPYGPVFDMYTANWQKEDAKILVVKAPAYVINPITWTPAKVREIHERDPDGAITDCESEFADPEQQLFKLTVLDRITRADPTPLRYRAGNDYSAALDPATRGNAWSLSIVTLENGRLRHVGSWEWQGTKKNPLDPKDVMRQCRDICRRYGIAYAHTDQWALDTMISIAADLGFSLIPDDRDDSEVNRSFVNLAKMMEADMVELGCNTEDNGSGRELRTDLLRVKKKPTGGVYKYKVILPLTGDGRHCDSAASFCLAAVEYLDEPVLDGAKQDDQEQESPDEREEREDFEHEAGFGDDDEVDDSWIDHFD